MKLFKKGDTVKRIHGYHLETVEGGVYTVREQTHSNLYLEGHDGSYRVECFELQEIKAKVITMEVINKISNLDKCIEELRNDLEAIQIIIHEKESELDSLKKEYGVQ